MIEFEDIKKYLPQYLSEKSQSELFKELKAFPSNIDNRLYSDILSEDPYIYQGDGINGMLVVNLPSNDVKEMRSMVISNSCDNSPENLRLFPSRIVYAPIFNLEKYRMKLIQEFSDEKDLKVKIEDHITTIKKQLITQIFYLPKCTGLENDSIVFFDRLNNCLVSEISSDKIKEKKIFSLSDYGFYLFLLKLSIHFTRIRENIERTFTKN